MPISVRQSGSVRFIVLEGEFTLSSHSISQPLDLSGRHLTDLGDTLRRLLDQGSRQIVLDLEEVTFFDSAGLGELIACRKRTLERGGDLVLFRPRGKVRELLKMLHLTRVFKIVDDEAEALASFRPVNV